MDNSNITLGRPQKILKNVQFGNRIRFGDNNLWVSYREQLVGPSKARCDFIGH